MNANHSVESYKQGGFIMKLKTNDGQEMVIEPGCVIGFYREDHCIVVMPQSGDGNRIKWAYGDDKRIAPACIRTEQDFYEIVQLIADMLGLRIEKDSFERTYGSAYKFVE